MTGWRWSDGSAAVGAPQRTDETTERSTLRLFSIPSSIADNSLCYGSHGETLWEFHDPRFLRATRENKAARRGNFDELATQ